MRNVTGGHIMSDLNICSLREEINDYRDVKASWEQIDQAWKSFEDLIEQLGYTELSANLHMAYLDLCDEYNDLLRQIVSSPNDESGMEEVPEVEPEELGFAQGELGEKKLTYAQRKALPDSAFVFPRERKYPFFDKAHSKNALARVSANGTPAEQAKVKSAVYSKYPEMKPEK